MMKNSTAALLVAAASGRAPRTEYVTREVHEHRAPTDESVALLAEMEEKARARIIERYRVDVGDNKLGAVEIVEMFDTMQRRVSFSLNGVPYTVKIDPHQAGPGFDAVARVIAEAIAVEIIERVAQQWRRF